MKTKTTTPTTVARGVHESALATTWVELVGRQWKLATLIQALDASDPRAVEAVMAQAVFDAEHGGMVATGVVFAVFGLRAKRIVARVRFAGDMSRAEEAVAEAMHRVHRRLPAFDPSRSKLSTWFVREVDYAARDVIDKDARAGVAGGDAGEVFANPRVPSECRQIDPDDTYRQAFWSVKDRLPEHAATACAAHSFGVSFAEIAEALGLSESYVRKITAEARRAVREEAERRE